MGLCVGHEEGLAVGGLGRPDCCWTSTAYGQVPTGDSVVGSGTTAPSPETFTFQFDIEASSGPSGEGPSGFVQLLVTSPQMGQGFLAAQ